MKVLPCPGTLSMNISPPKRSTSRLQIERPNPVPSRLRARPSPHWRNGSKMLWCCSDQFNSVPDGGDVPFVLPPASHGDFLLIR